VRLDYLFLDGSHFKYHANAAAEPVLAAWGIDTDGKPVFVGLDAAASESGDAWESFLSDLGERGLDCPLLVISDGAAGLIGAAERTMGAALRQRCLIHRCRNVVAKVSKNAVSEVKADYWAIFDLPESVEPGLDAVAVVQARIDTFARRWRDSYPAAVRCLLDDRDSLTVYLRFPREHWPRIRHSNFIERTIYTGDETPPLERCAHQGGPLHEGRVEDGCVVCPWHSSRYRLSDGAALSGPTAHPQPAVQVRVHDSKVEVRRWVER
jgi:transposase-like protein